jgi:hypothetical protein
VQGALATVQDCREAALESDVNELSTPRNAFLPAVVKMSIPVTLNAF